MDAVPGGVLDLADALGGKAGDTVDRLREAGGDEARFALLDHLIASRMEDGPTPSGEVLWAWRRLNETGGRVRVGELSAELGWSRKRLITAFRQQVGLPPKAAARIIRFGRAVELLRRGGRPLADIALECGYCDQAHLNREVRDLSGTTPTDLLSSLREDPPARDD
jgi:AraC-like DNA-binding protein